MSSRFDRGGPAPPPASPPAPPPAPQKRGSHYLEVYKDKTVIDTIDLSGLSTYTLGRDADACEIPLEHASCSRRHARLERQADGSVWIEDLGSAQGTYVDGAPEPIAPRRRTALAPGASLCFGRSTRTYVVRAPGAATKPKLSGDDKRKRLWGGAKRDRPGASEADRDRESSNLERWGAAAGALGDAARSDKFLALMGAKKHKVAAAPAGDAARSEVLAKLEDQFETARRRGYGSRGL